MKKLYVFLAAAVFVIGVGISELCLLTASDDAVVIGALPDAGETVATFFDELKSGEYQAAMERVNNYDSLGFEKEGTELIELYKQTLLECLEVSLSQPESTEPESRLVKVQGIEMTFLDCRKLMPAVSDSVTDAVMEYMNDGYVIENDEQAMTFVYSALSEDLVSSKQYCTTEHFDLYLYYDGESWRIEISDELARALFGYIDDFLVEEVR